MLTASTPVLGSSKVVLQSSVVLIRDHHNVPLVLVVEIAPGIQHVYSVAINREEFSSALNRYGIDFTSEVKTVRA